MNSRLYTGTIAHSRVRPKRNKFTYRGYFCYFDLAELDELDARFNRFGHNSRALVSFYDSDHGPRDGTPLRPWIDGLLGKVGIDLEGGQVGVLTIPRVLGGTFYPVAFWYCVHADGTTRAVLAEVQNTFRDHHNYLLHNHGEPYEWSDRSTHEKAFYVSPFVQQENVTHAFSVTAPEDTTRITVNDIVDGSLLLGTTLTLHAEEFTDAALLRTVVSLGPMSARALVLIHWQALKLAIKGVPFHGHTPPPAEETSL